MMGMSRKPGFKHSAETRAKMSASAFARADGCVTRGFAGHRHDKKTRAKIKEARARQHPEPRLGRTHNEAFRERQSAQAIKQKRDYDGRFA
jgi:NUMOD3 motif